MNLKEYRINENLSQIKMASKLGVSLNTYILWERGVMTPNPKNQEKIDELLKSEK